MQGCSQDLKQKTLKGILKIYPLGKCLEHVGQNHFRRGNLCRGGCRHSMWNAEGHLWHSTISPPCLHHPHVSLWSILQWKSHQKNSKIWSSHQDHMKITWRSHESQGRKKKVHLQIYPREFTKNWKRFPVHSQNWNYTKDIAPALILSSDCSQEVPLTKLNQVSGSLAGLKLHTGQGIYCPSLYLDAPFKDTHRISYWPLEVPFAKWNQVSGSLSSLE